MTTRRTFKDTIEIKGDDPRILFTEDDASSGARKWLLFPSSGSLTIQTLSDVEAAVSTALQITQSSGAWSSFGIGGTGTAASFSVSRIANVTGGVSVTGGTASTPTKIAAVSSAADADLQLAPKGSGYLILAAWTSSSDAAVNGYFEVRDSSGNVRKLATIE